MTIADEMYFDVGVSLDHRQGFRAGLEKALELTNELIQDLKDDRKIEQAMWIEVIRDWIETEHSFYEVGDEE